MGKKKLNKIFTLIIAGRDRIESVSCCFVNI